MKEITRCMKCVNYQEYEPGAGIWAGCVADELYADEDGQILIPEKDAEIREYILNLGEGCPYFSELGLNQK